MDIFESLSSTLQELPVIGNIFQFIETVYEAAKELVGGIFDGSSEGGSSEDK